jgi:putative NADH-flavin reductase
MEVVVLGGTGRAGSAVVERAVARGHDVTAFVRSPERLRERVGGLVDRLRLVVGDADDPGAVREALRGRGAAIGALGARLRAGTELSDLMGTVIRAAEEVGLPRLVTVAQVGVFLTKTAPEFANVRTEHLRVLDLLRSSSLAWTAVAPPAIEERPSAGGYALAIDARGPRWTISRLDLADALLDALERPEWVGRVIGVSEPVQDDDRP